MAAPTPVQTLSANYDNRARRRLELTDLFLFRILLAHLPVTALLVPIGYGTEQFAIASSLAIGVVATLGYLSLKGTRAFSALAGVLLMSLSAVMIQTQLGRIEMHFHIFSAVALLLIYRHWLPVVAAAATIALHHALLTALQLNEATLGGMPLMVFNYGCSWGIMLLHAAFVVLESVALIYYAESMRRDEAAADALVEAVQKVSRDHDLSTRIESVDGEVADSFNAMLDHFADLTAELMQAADRIKAEAQTMATHMDSARDRIGDQHQQTEHIGVSVEQMAENIKQVTESIHSAASNAERSKRDALSSESLFQQADEAAQELQQLMHTAVGSVKQLEVGADTIGSVVDVIRAISEQTNLLALNAAIEAARAGENGRGFAVVADEVRTLAGRTQSATGEIQDIIGRLQADIDDSSGKIVDGQSKSSDVSARMAEVRTKLQGIIEAVGDIHNQSSRVAEASEEQSLAADAITKGILSIAEASKEIVNRTDANAASASQLSDVSEKLQGMVSAYRV